MAISERRARHCQTLPAKALAKVAAQDPTEAGQSLITKLRSLPSPSRSRGGESSKSKGFVDRREPAPPRSSYREMLRASGQQALMRVQNNELPPSSRASLPLPPPPNQPPAFGNGSGPAPSLLLSAHLCAAPGDLSTRSAPPSLPTNAFSLPPADLTPCARSPAAAAFALPPADLTPSCASTVTPMVGAWPDLSPTPGAGSRYWPEASPTGFQASPTGFHLDRVEENDLMYIAMPEAKRLSMDGEQIAAQLRAVAPAMYED